jgi:protein TonB
MKKFIIFSILIHGLLGAVLLRVMDEPPLKSETAQPIWITWVESKKERLPAGAALPTLPIIETIPPPSAPHPPAALQEPPGEPALKSDSGMEESSSPALVEDSRAVEETDREIETHNKVNNYIDQGIVLNGFLEEVRSRIDRAKRYPWLARLQGIEGTTRLRFRILPSGEPAEVEIAQSSQSRLLDQEAIETVRRVARFPQPPVASNLGVVVRLPLVFHLDGGSPVEK